MPTFYSWIGVTMYLTLDAIESTLRTISSSSERSRIVLSFNRPAALLTGLEAEVGRLVGAIIHELGEPIIATFDAPEAESLMQRCDFRDVAHFAPMDSWERYFEPRGRETQIAAPQRLLQAKAANNPAEPKARRIRHSWPD